MSDIVERLRQEVNAFYGKQPCGVMVEAADEIEKLRAAICEWAASICGYEGVLFLEGLKHEEFINSILDARAALGEKE